MSTAQAVAATLAVLSALGELHRTGHAHGAVTAAAVGIGSDGWVRLAADAAGEPGRGAAGDVQDVGRLLCQLLGVEVESHPALPAPAAERAAPALVALARRLASVPSEWAVDEVWVAVKDAAGFWGAEPQLVDALGTLAERADGGSPVERAVTRIIPGPPLRAEPPPLTAPPAREPFSVSLARPRLSRAVLPALPAAAALPSPSLPALPKVGSPRRFLSSPVAKIAGAALVGGLLLGALAGGLAAHTGAARASVTRPPAARHSAAPAAAKPAGLFAATPDVAVSKFFQLVQQRRLDQAALLWKPKMAAAVNLQSQFGGVSSIDLRRDTVVAESDQLGIATVAVDWVQTDSDGTSHEFSGVIYTDTGPVLWRWDSWQVSEVQPQAAGSGPGGGDGGDGG